jgi:hypothetical protein
MLCGCQGFDLAVKLTGSLSLSSNKRQDVSCLSPLFCGIEMNDVAAGSCCVNHES